MECCLQQGLKDGMTPEEQAKRLPFRLIHAQMATPELIERMKKLLLTLPRNEQGKPSEDYKQSKVNINGLPMTKTTNPLRIGHPDEEGEEMQQTVLLYFQENKRRVFAIVMLVADEKAQADLDAITSSIQIEK